MSDRSLRVIKPRVQVEAEDAAALLKEALAAVESGEVHAVMIVMFRPDGSYRDMGSASIGRLQKLGILSEMQHDLQHSQ